jgi:hypothetical protein
MTCPVCGLLNPEHTAVCDCGYDFATKTGGVYISFWRRHRTALITFGIVLGLIVAGAFALVLSLSRGWIQVDS